MQCGGVVSGFCVEATNTKNEIEWGRVAARGLAGAGRFCFLIRLLEIILHRDSTGFVGLCVPVLSKALAGGE